MCYIGVLCFHVTSLCSNSGTRTYITPTKRFPHHGSCCGNFIGYEIRIFREFRAVLCCSSVYYISWNSWTYRYPTSQQALTYSKCYFSTHDEALVLKYWQFLVEYCLSVLAKKLALMSRRWRATKTPHFASALTTWQTCEPVT